jgi:1-acyl-sn-glycerol-3-phosphate acyltransferase
LWVRRRLGRTICWLGRLSYEVGGMHLKIKGKMASRDVAPILVIAPHSTFMDAVIVYVTNFPSIISRRESGLNPFIGSMLCSPL